MACGSRGKRDRRTTSDLELYGLAHLCDIDLWKVIIPFISQDPSRDHKIDLRTSRGDIPYRVSHLRTSGFHGRLSSYMPCPGFTTERKALVHRFFQFWSQVHVLIRLSSVSCAAFQGPLAGASAMSCSEIHPGSSFPSRGLYIEI